MWPGIPLALGALLIGGCGDTRASAPLAGPTGPDGGTCPAGKFLYDDFSCPPPIPLEAGTPKPPCTPEGDHLCHERCSSSADCVDPARPYCRILGLYAGHDWNCNVGVRICRETATDDCPNDPPLR